jgi:hypothetical protein
MNTCPDCKCQFVQPFKCTTCGAEKLYDATIRSQAKRIEALERVITRHIKWRDKALRWYLSMPFRQSKSDREANAALQQT